MGQITIHTDRIGMPIDFEASVMHLVNCLPEVQFTCRILSVSLKLQLKVNDQELQIATMRLKINTGDGSDLGDIYVAQRKKRAKKY